MATTFPSTFIENGATIVLPFPYSSRLLDDVPSELKNVWWLQAREDGAPSTGYYARFRGAKVAVEIYQGVWFELRFDPTWTRIEAFRVARPLLGLIHAPTGRMYIDELRAQTEVTDRRNDDSAPRTTVTTYVRLSVKIVHVSLGCLCQPLVPISLPISVSLTVTSRLVTRPLLYLSQRL